MSYLGHKLFSKQVFKPDASQLNGCDIFITRIFNKFLRTAGVKEEELCIPLVLKMKALVKACWSDYRGINTTIQNLGLSEESVWKADQLGGPAVEGASLTDGQKSELLKAGLAALAQKLFRTKAKVTEKQQAVIGAYTAIVKDLILKGGEDASSGQRLEKRGERAQKDLENKNALALMGRSSDETVLSRAEKEI